MFGEIFDRHHATVFRFVARRVGTTDAGDITADIFVRAFSIRERYDKSKPNSLPWLYGIATNVIGDRLRQTERRRRRYVAHAAEDGDQFSDADARLVAESASESLNTALAELSSRDRDALLLFALDGLTYAEIANVLRIPPGTVGSRISRARRRLLELMPDLGQIAGVGEQDNEDR